jgi:hypothetical protein
MRCKLRDETSGKTVGCSIVFENGKVWVQLDGYGECSSQAGRGYPVGIEYYEDQMWVTVWGDINRDDPTERLCIDGARESNRNTEGDER